MTKEHINASCRNKFFKDLIILCGIRDYLLFLSVLKCGSLIYEYREEFFMWQLQSQNHVLKSGV